MERALFGWRFQAVRSADVAGLAVWAPWREPHRPLVYQFWRRLF